MLVIQSAAWADKINDDNNNNHESSINPDNDCLCLNNKQDYNIMMTVSKKNKRRCQPCNIDHATEFQRILSLSSISRIQDIVVIE